MVGIRDRVTRYTSLYVIFPLCITVSMGVPLNGSVRQRFVDRIGVPIIVAGVIAPLLITACYLDYKKNFPSLPPVLRNVKHFDIWQIQSVRQKNEACAWYAVLNACAIQQLINEHERITSRSIAQMVRKKIIPSIEQNAEKIEQAVGVSLWEGLDIPEIAQLIQMMGLKNVYNIHLSPQGELPYIALNMLPSELLERTLLKLSGSLYLIVDLSKLLIHIAQQDVPVKHIVLSLQSNVDTNHAVLISIVKREGKKPLLIYMDSNNTPFSSCRLDYIVSFFVCAFIKRLDEAMISLTES